MQEISTRTKSSKTTLRSGAVQGVKKPFSSKKCIFWPENDVFSKKSFYKKLISDQNYIISTCKKIHFQNKVMRLQFSPDSYPYIRVVAADLTQVQEILSALAMARCLATSDTRGTSVTSSSINTAATSTVTSVELLLPLSSLHGVVVIEMATNLREV